MVQPTGLEAAKGRMKEARGSEKEIRALVVVQPPTAPQGHPGTLTRDANALSLRSREAGSVARLQ